MKTRLGFQIYDEASQGRPIAIDEEKGGALVFGSKSMHRVQANGVLPAHFVVLPHEGMLLGASSDPRMPAHVNGRPLGQEWTVLELPCRVEVGTAVVDFIVMPLELGTLRPRAAQAAQAAHPSRVSYGLDEMDGTRVGPLPAPARTARAPRSERSERSQRSGSAPVAMRGPASDAVAAQSVSTSTSTSLRSMRPGEITMRAARRLRDDYKRLSRPKRLLAPVAVLLLVLSFLPTRAEAAGSTSAEMELAPVRSDAALAALGAPVPTTKPSATTPAAAAPAAAAAAPAKPGAPVMTLDGLLPSARSLPVAGAAKLSPRERVLYHKAIEATLAGDFATAFRLYDQLGQAHPEATEIKAAQRVLAAKLKR